MLQIGIECESDMEFALEHTVRVAKSNGVSKTITLSFNSHGMMNIFMTNLFDEFERAEVPNPNGLQLHLLIPEDDSDE